MRALSFLGAAAAPHYQAVASLVARAMGVPEPALAEPGLVGLHDAVADPQPALAFLCGLPYVRLRAAGAPVTALAAPVAEQPGTPEEAAAYSTVLVARPGAPALERCRIGFNNHDSLSGWVLPRSGLQIPTRCSWVGPTGSHRRSLELLRGGRDRRGADRLLDAPRSSAIGTRPTARSSSAGAVRPDAGAAGGGVRRRRRRCTPRCGAR